MASLNDYKSVFRTDKFDCWPWNGVIAMGSGKAHNYVDMFYDGICVPIKDTATAILEVGIYEGYSLLLWNAFFTKARIYGVDVLPNPYPNHGRIAIYGHTDGYSPTTVDLFRVHEPAGYDMIIDDGLHFFETQKVAFERYFDLVKPGGYYVIEDITGEWSLDALSVIAQEKGTVRTYKSPASIDPYDNIFALTVMKGR